MSTPDDRLDDLTDLIRPPGIDDLGALGPTEAALRARLQRSWYALFAHHSPLTPIQRRGAFEIAGGAECLLVACGDPGRLETLVCGIFERTPRVEVERPAALMICPDRATMLSASRRLSGAASRGTLRVDTWTGMSSAPPKGRHLLITTLRHADGLLARHPGWLRDLKHVVVDELGRFEGTARADQLAAVLYRLRRVARAGGGEVQISLASGSLADPEGAAARYLEAGVVVQVPPARQGVEVRATPAPDLRAVVKAATAPPPPWATEGAVGRTVIYAPYARESEALYEALLGQAPFGDEVYVRHKGTDDRRSAAALRAFAAHKTAALITALPIEDEIAEGVSRVIQWSPPPDVATLVSRIAPRGFDDPHLDVALLPRSLTEAVRMAFLVDRASMDDWCVDPAAYHPGTMLQQACSLVFQNPKRRLTAKALHDRLPPWQARWWSLESLAEVLGRGHRWFKADGRGGFLPTDRLMARFEAGRVHGVAPAQVASCQHRADAQAYLHFLGVPPGVGVLLPDVWVHGLGTVYGRLIAAALRDMGLRVDGQSGMGIKSHGRPPLIPPSRIRAVIRREAQWLTLITAQGPEFQWLTPAMKGQALVEAISPEAVADAWAGLDWRIPDLALGQRVNVAVGAL